MTEAINIVPCIASKSSIPTEVLFNDTAPSVEREGGV